MGFLDDLGGSLNSMLQEHMGLAENKPGNLDSDTFGVLNSFGKLGDFASRIDKSAQRSYVEDGVIRNIRPRALEIISQEPDMTIVIKKRLFASLKENYRADLLDEDEVSYMAKNGLEIASIGIESGNNKILENINKKTTTEEI
ncbi:hypothetical protein LCGC14_0523010, partial [marine sediment metagenome]